MIHYIKKDITTVENGIVAHGCNCQGVMGSGVALAIRNRWPDVYNTYSRFCKAYNNTSELLGQVHFVGVSAAVHEGTPNNRLFVANMFTQHKFGTDKVHAEPEAIKNALMETVHMASLFTLSVYMPRVGCGLGGLDWKRDVQPIVEQVSEEYPAVDIYVCDL